MMIEFKGNLLPGTYLLSFTNVFDLMNNYSISGLSFVLYLATRHIFGLVLWFGFGFGCNGWWGFFWGFCQRIWFVGDCRGFSSMSRRCLLHGDCGGTDWGGVLRLSPDGRVVAVTGTAEATHTLSWWLGAVHWNKGKTWLRPRLMDGIEECLYFIN